MENFFYPPGFSPIAPAHNNNNNNNNSGSSDINFTPLFRLLDDFGRYSGSHSNSRPGARAALPTFQPKFDVRETSAAYELHGELPGAQRENIHIEFTDPQTLQVRGRIERLHASSNDNAKAITEAGDEDKTVRDDGSTISESGDETEKNSRGTPPLRATVQDEAEAKAEEQGTEVLNTPATSVAAPANNNNNNNSYHPTSFVVPTIPPKKAAIKYWVTERSIGEFTRNFSFPARVEQDGVSANLKDGILTVVIPKSKKHETRRIIVA
jgi:HSP20 family molecular chaperone IbpA